MSNPESDDAGPNADDRPQGVLRKPESDYLTELWADRVAEVQSDEQTVRKIADGGTRIRGCFDDV